MCMNERSRFDRSTSEANSDLKIEGYVLQDCAQYCKSISNRFAFGFPNQCICQTGTRETGRCKLISNRMFNLYEFRYPGKICL